MLRAKIYNRNRCIGEYNVEIDFQNSESINIRIHGTSQDIDLRKIAHTLFITRDIELSVSIVLNSDYEIHTKNLFITNVAITTDSVIIEGISTAYIIREKKKLYEKIIEDIEEDHYTLFQTLVREFDTYRILELSYAKDKDE